MLVVAALVAVGIALARVLPDVSAGMWAAVGLAGPIGAAAYAAWSRRRLVTLRPLALAVAVVVAAGALGATREASHRDWPPSNIHSLADAASDRDDATIALWGTVLDVPQRTDWAIRLTLAVDSAGRGEARGTVSGRVQASLMHNDGQAVYPALQSGDRVRLVGDLKPLSRRRNPAQMDYGAYLRRQGISAQMRVADETGVQFLRPSRSLVTRSAERVRRHVRRTVAQHVPTAESRGLLLALLLADRSTIETETLDAFRETGLMHLLAVSGLHVGLVGLTLYMLLKPVLGRLHLRRRSVEVARSVVTLAILGVYVWVAGASVSVVRAFVMVAVVIVGRTFERRVDTLNALGLAALALLVHWPAALFDVGFQLSFGAVAAIVTLTPLVTAAVPERIRQSPMGTALVGSVATSLAATVGTAPALLAHFGRLPLGGLVLNVPAIPLTALTLGAGLGCVVLAPIPPLAAALGAVADLAGRVLLAITEAGAQTLGWATYSRYLDAPTALIACALTIGALALWRRPVARRRLVLAAVASVAIGMWASVVRGDERPRLDVLFLDVGQGDATLLALPNGRHVLVDAGLRSPYVDEGARTVLPHLQRYGIDHLDALVLTHADADHIGGAASVLEAVRVGRLVVNGQSGETDLWADVMAAADSLNVPIHAVGTGDTLDLDPSVRLRVLGPAGRMASPNDASVMLRVEHGATRWLLTGDAEAAGESALVDRFATALAADVVKVGHHGSETSSTEPLVDAAGRPLFAVVSVARRNRYGLPDEAPLARWTATGAEVLQTSYEGAIWLRSDGQTVERVDWRKE